jgi:hypothetical protein
MNAAFSVRLPRVFARVLALAGLSLAAVSADVSQAAAQPGQDMPAIFSDPAVANYRLTTASLDKFVRATNALKQLEGEEFDIEDRFESEDPEDMNIADIAAAMDSEPRIKSAINGAGMSSREYITFIMAMVQATIGSVMVQMGGEQALNDMAPGVLKDNIRFFTQHRAAFEALDIGDRN